MKLTALLSCALLCGCQPTQTQTAVPSTVIAQSPEQTAARAYLAEVRASLNVAYLKDRETTTSGDCDSPRFEDISPPQLLKVEACRLSIGSSADYRIEVRFVGGQSWIADPGGIRQAGAEALQLLN
ncbi:hypothetical protein [Deinococcus sp. AJ005]|uniref:hypothetical protein n=1 Tax=Deinococcus sp. AJ005 TaxID=2652443 RepID=UPI00125CA56F|nr:hypothetical protein [Deinococcus sp. AJ005]QFP75538.1 hypothetical protein DAAJ005_02990 [Deinococcus sp. AJ005]